MEYRLEYIDLSGPAPKCQTCLSVDRRLRLMGRYEEMFRRIVGPSFNPVAESGFDTSQLSICWVCAAVLRNIVQFHNRVYAANSVLGQSLQQPLTNLAIDVLEPISCSIQGSDIETVESSPIQIKEDCKLEEVTEAFANDGYDVTNDPFDIEIEVEVKPIVIKQETEHFEHDELRTIKTEESKPDMAETKPESSKNSNIKREKIKIKSEKKTKHKNPVKLTGNEAKYVFTRFKTLHRIGMVQRVKMNTQVEEENMFNKVLFSPAEIEECMEKERQSDYFRTRKRQCHKCVLGFERGQNLNYHMRSHKPGKYMCSVCKKAFREKNLLEDHIKEHYYKFVCTLCGFSCLARNHIVWHYKRRHEYGYQCRKCEIIVADKEQFLAHHKQWHTVYICDYCGKKCSMRHKMAAHIMAAHIRTNSKYPCQVCGATYKRAETLRQHTLLRHASDGTGAYCVECDRHFEHQFAYKDHLMRLARHQPKREKSMFPCPDCDKVFSKTTYMREHRNLVHLHIYNFHCDQCDKNFLRRSALNRHTWKNHEHRPLPRNKICQFCDRGFTCNKTLNNHIRTHTGERPFACDQCSAAFAQRAALTSHLKKAHKH